jgi:hypothetical protein
MNRTGMWSSINVVNGNSLACDALGQCGGDEIV